MSAPSDDPFALLGLPRSFRIDSGALRRAHLRRAAAAHPDRAGAAADDESVRRSAALNEARGVLADPVLRGEALLRLAGVVSDPAADAMAPEFLMEMMELREAADDAAERGDAPRIAELRRDADARRVALLDAIAADFDDGRLESARARLGELRAVDRLAARLAEPADDEPLPRE